MTRRNTAGNPTDDERAGQVMDARWRSGRMTKAAVVLLTATVPATFAVGLLISDGERDAGDPLIRLLLLLVTAALAVAVVLLINAWMTRNSSLSDGADLASRRRVKAALRDGSTTDPQVDALARKEAEQQVRRRWVFWALGVVLALQTLNAVSTDRTSTRWTSGLGALAWAVLLYQHWRTTQRARRYLAGPTSGYAER
ncbi:hypothetical protein [Micromonospora sp. WMMC250]|uniref:hypothetical protein n=1 Tax=Micromonospora sp. WMMC250 TaxID=3014781 RepID=UPI0022B69458|nr:hypothetical protein [Micromonospora sp. WMMC250]MCZ7376431.1 hypothetical protein [Micromonospora sp. WMMC250]